MSYLPRVTIAMGTRPEAIKLASVVKVFKACESLQTRVLLSGQHREMIAQVLETFEIKIDSNLQLMSSNQSLSEMTAKAVEGLAKDYKAFHPELVLVHGDTTTAFAAALAAFYERIPVGHIEAGLRTDNLLDPFPEEANRRLISQIATLNFAPTKDAASNLKLSGAKSRCFVTGNTVIDALQDVSKKMIPTYSYVFDCKLNTVILATVHRRENWGKPLEDIAEAFLQILEKYIDLQIVLPMHKNPLVRQPLQSLLGNHPRITLLETLEYPLLLSVLKDCKFLITDSGGLQEEASALKKPVLLLRRTTERQEGVKAGSTILVGTSPRKIVKEAIRLLDNPYFYKKMTKPDSQFGDGNASSRILKACRAFLGV